MPRSARNTLGALALLLLAHGAMARDYVLVVGSSTVFPFAATVSERIGSSAEFKAPKVEPWGTGGGFKLFCRGVGAEEVDIAMASRDITAEELAHCAANGVTEILKLRVGSDGITFATSKKLALALSRRELYLALARRVPDPENPDALIDNPYERWDQIAPHLPEAPIRVYGPPLTSGTRDLLVQQGLSEGCRTFPRLKALEAADPDLFRDACGSIREDGTYVTTGENDNLIVRKVAASEHALGIFGFSYFDQNRERLQAATIEGVSPTFESIYDGEYPLARPLYLYVKQVHVGRIPGLFPFLEEFTRDAAVGEDGYLSTQGLVPVPEGERAANVSLLSRIDPG